MWRETNVLQEWKVFTFTDVVEVNPKRSLKKGEECPYIEMKSLLPNHKKVEKIDKRVYEGGGSRFRNGDTLFARITPCLENGKIAFVNELDPDQAGYGSTEFIVMSGKEGVTDNLFVYYLSRWDEIRDFAIKNMTGTSGRQRVPNDIFKQRKIYLPPLLEQRRIASILSAFDDKIELNNQMNRTQEEMASAIFKSWFVDFEPFQDGEFEYNEEMDKEIPKGWVVKSVYSLADYINGMAFKMSDFAAEGLPIIKIAELNNGITDNTKLYNGEYKEKYFLRNGDILFSWSASLGIYLWDGGDAIFNQHIFNVKPKGTMTKPILYFLLKEIVNEFIQIAAFRATTMGHIKKTHLQEKKITIPDDDTMKTINDKLEPIFKQIFANKLENHSLAQIRDSLLPKLLSGEIRVNPSENNSMFKEAEDVDQ